MLTPLLLAGLAFAQDADVVRRVPAAQYDPARCTHQQVHTPAGKMVHNAPIVHCRVKAQIVRADRVPAPAEARTARD